MKVKEIIALEKRLLPELPDLDIHRAIMFLPPVRHTLRGFVFDPSGLDKRKFYVDTFFLPLCVPRDYLSLEHGRRLGNASWCLDSSGLETELTHAMRREIPFLRSLESVECVVEVLTEKARHSKDPYMHEASAYMLARAGKMTESRKALNDLIELLDTNVNWQREMSERATGLMVKIENEPTVARRQLEGWEEYSIQKLGLGKFL